MKTNNNYLNKIFIKSSECMDDIPDNSVKLVVTSPPYNIDIKFGNKTSKGKIIESKGIKYQDKKPENIYRELLGNVFKECKRVLRKDGSIWINIKNKYENGVVYVKLTGACSNCPLIDSTLEDGIEEAIINEVPEVIKVVNEE